MEGYKPKRRADAHWTTLPENSNWSKETVKYDIVADNHPYVGPDSIYPAQAEDPLEDRPSVRGRNK